MRPGRRQKVGVTTLSRRALSAFMVRVPGFCPRGRELVRQPWLRLIGHIGAEAAVGPLTDRPKRAAGRDRTQAAASGRLKWSAEMAAIRCLALCYAARK